MRFLPQLVLLERPEGRVSSSRLPPPAGTELARREIHDDPEISTGYRFLARAVPARSWLHVNFTTRAVVGRARLSL